MTPTHSDVLVVGAGAGGGALARALAPSGHSIRLLNRGGFLPQEEENWDARKIFGEGRYKTQERWVDARTGEDFRAQMYYHVGGNTKVYGSALLRMRPEDFTETRHEDGLSPAWPLSYGDLAPHYAAAERAYHVHGRRGTDPFEPPASADFPHPPLPHDERVAEVAADLRAQDVGAFPLPMGLKMSAENPGGGPFVLRETFAERGQEGFDGFPDRLHLKADAETAAVRPALEAENVSLETGVRATRVLTGSDGREVTGVEATGAGGDGSPRRFTADVYVLACGAVQTAALLLRSASDAHPDGLANESGRVGRHFMRHTTSKLYAVDEDRPNDAHFQKTLAVNDYYYGAGDDSAYGDVPLGHAHLMGKHTGWMIGQDLSEEARSERDLHETAAHSMDWWLQTEDLPLRENRVDLAEDGRVRLRYTPTNEGAHDALAARLKDALRGCGFDRFHRVRMPLRVVNHQCGTCRMGRDSEASVVDPHGRAHGVENLFLSDASVFPSAAATNPSLTVTALSYRLADHLRAEVL